LAVTGYVQTEDDWHILLENVATQEVRMVRPGDEEFGYLIKYIDVTADQLVLEKDGQEARLKLGNHKKESRPQPKSSPDNPQGNRVPQEGNGSRERSND
jgi:hypothetical protein